MANFIPVNGQEGPDEPLFGLLKLFANNGRTVSFEHLEGKTIASHLDVQEINARATELAEGKTIYGDAVIFTNAERLSG
jgi:hypothetical protein